MVWLKYGDRRLGRRAVREISLALERQRAAASTISFWEVGMRLQKGQISLGQPLDDWREDLLQVGLIEIPVNGLIAMRAALLEDLHGDPADRIIVATALQGHRLVTADHRILRWPGNLNRLDATQ